MFEPAHRGAVRRQGHPPAERDARVGRAPRFHERRTGSLLWRGGRTSAAEALRNGERMPRTRERPAKIPSSATVSPSPAIARPMLASVPWTDLSLPTLVRRAFACRDWSLQCPWRSGLSSSATLSRPRSADERRAGRQRDPRAGHGRAVSDVRIADRLHRLALCRSGGVQLGGRSGPQRGCEQGGGHRRLGRSLHDNRRAPRHPHRRAASPAPWRRHREGASLGSALDQREDADQGWQRIQALGILRRCRRPDQCVLFRVLRRRSLDAADARPGGLRGQHGEQPAPRLSGGKRVPRSVRASRAAVQGSRAPADQSRSVRGVQAEAAARLGAAPIGGT